MRLIGMLIVGALLTIALPCAIWLHGYRRGIADEQMVERARSIERAVWTCQGDEGECRSGFSRVPRRPRLPPVALPPVHRI